MLFSLIVQRILDKNAYVRKEALLAIAQILNSASSHAPVEIANTENHEIAVVCE